MTATVLQVRRAADLYIATGTPVAASLVISICAQLDEAKESINALTLALETERDAANLYAKQVAHWIEKHDALLEQQLETMPTEVHYKRGYAPVNWAAVIHYPDCWGTAAYPELRDAIHEALAWSGCSVCKPSAPTGEPNAK
jgi:hypothetical protein